VRLVNWTTRRSVLARRVVEANPNANVKNAIPYRKRQDNRGSQSRLDPEEPPNEALVTPGPKLFHAAEATSPGLVPRPLPYSPRLSDGGNLGQLACRSTKNRLGPKSHFPHLYQAMVLRPPCAPCRGDEEKEKAKSRLGQKSSTVGFL
jgi:hypothetical protein